MPGIYILRRLERKASYKLRRLGVLLNKYKKLCRQEEPIGKLYEYVD